MVFSSSYPVVHYPAELLKVLQLTPKRETYRDKPPERTAFQNPLGTKHKLWCLFLRLVGKSAEAARLTLAAHETGRQAYDAAMAAHLAGWKAFEEVQDTRFTEAALLDYRRPHIGKVLATSTPETGRCSVVAAGAAEYGFYRHLCRTFGDRIYRRFVVQLEGRSYHPDFAFFDPATRLRIDIELDEPYGLHDRLAIHFVEPSEKSGQLVAVDKGRDEAFLAGRWLVVRFAESQVVTDPAGCCRVIADIISQITGETFADLAETPPVHPTPRWTREQANLWAEADYRKLFLEQAEREAVQPLALNQQTFVPSPHQQAIFDFLTDGRGHGLVTAVAGSGKSTTLLEATRVIRTRDARARILLLAFNRSIRNELEARINASEIDSIEVATLNSYGKRVLERTLGQTEINTRKYANLILHAAREFNIPLGDTRSGNKGGREKSNRFYAQKLVNLCRSYSTVNPRDPAQLKQLGERYSVPPHRTELLEPVIVRALELGKQLATEAHQVDFDDQCYLPVRLNFPVTPYDYVFVDECQDLTQTQLELVRRAVGEQGRLLFVGDPRQAIMGFRGADNDSIETIRQLPGGVTELDLTVCYRCPTSHLELARTLMPNIAAADGAKAGLAQALAWSDIATHAREGDLLFARTNTIVQCAVLELIAGGHTINYAAASSVPSDEAEGGAGAVLTALKLLHDAARVFPKALSAPPRQPWEKEDPVRKMLPRILECLQHAAASWGGDFCEFVAYRTLPDSRFGVTVCSAHQAKGLEAEHVFILGESAFGNSRPEQPAWEREQELNLKYVAYTRAKSTLYRVKQAA